MTAQLADLLNKTTADHNIGHCYGHTYKANLGREYKSSCSFEKKKNIC